MVLFDFILGDAALLEAAKKGNLARVQKLASQENINCRDTQGRNSTPLHLAGINSVFNIVWKNVITSNKPLSRIRHVFVLCWKSYTFFMTFELCYRDTSCLIWKVDIIRKWLVKLRVLSSHRLNWSLWLNWWSWFILEYSVELENFLLILGKEKETIIPQSILLLASVDPLI